ncbi:MAG: TIGR04282 family arsenosugar biosynthesis glycosyltransferase [Burkholderiales bacterium]
MIERCNLIIMAKAPRPGFAKTRLIPALGAEGAAALAARMLDATLAHALGSDAALVDLCCAPDTDHPAFARHAASPRVRLSGQGEGDLGARMARAFERHLVPGRAVLMIGTDAPALDAALLRQAAYALQDADAVFVPALDGGYALIGLHRAAPSLFAAMVWSTASVMADTRERLKAAGLRHIELAPVADIDEPADLAHLPPGWLT